MLDRSRLALFLFAAAALLRAQPAYDLMLKGGHVIDPKNGISAVRDVAIKDGRIAAVAARLDDTTAAKTIDVSGLYVTPGLVDIHVHVFAGTGEPRSYAGDYSVYPDGFTFRNGVTTVVDAGSSGWRNFADFRDRIVLRSKTRVLAFLNIVGAGMRGDAFENNLADMDPKSAAAVAVENPNVVVGFKAAHYRGPEWTPIENAVAAGQLANLPVMVDFGANRPERPISTLLEEKLRPGDIYTHVYSGLRGEMNGSHVSEALLMGRKRGIVFDVGHGAGSFVWGVAAPAVAEGFLPDSISTDLHTSSMNAGMKDLLNVMSKFLAMGMSVDDVIRRATWNPAREIHHEGLGHLSPGATADIAVLSIANGNFGFTDMYGARLGAKRKLVCELTVRNGKVVYDLNGIGRPDWRTLPPDYRSVADPSWDAVTLHAEPKPH